MTAPGITAVGAVPVRVETASPLQIFCELDTVLDPLKSLTRKVMV